MPRMAAVHRLPRAVLVAGLTALVLGGLAGVTASGGPQPDADKLAVPMPAVGDRWSYQAVLEGDWTITELDEEIRTGVPFTFAEMEWLEPRVIRDTAGNEVAVDHLDDKAWFHLELDLDLPDTPYYTPDMYPTWFRQHYTFDFRQDSGEGVAMESLTKTRQQSNGASGMTVAGIPVEASGSTRQLDGVARDYMQAAAPCLARAPYQGGELDLDQDLTLYLNCLIGGQYGIPYDYGTYRFGGREAVAGYSTVRFDSTDGDASFWLSSAVPVPVQLRGETAGRTITLSLSSWEPGSTPLGSSPLPVQPGAAPAIAFADRQPWGPDDNGVAHPFPASAAYQAASAAPQWSDLRDWTRSHPDHAPFLVQYHEDLAGTPQKRSWLFGLTGGGEAFGFTVTDERFDALPMIPSRLSFDSNDALTSSFLLSPPAVEQVPKVLPTVASTLARWDAYQRTEGESEVGNGWAFRVSCFMDCEDADEAMVQVAAGHDAVAGYYFDSNANSPVQPLGNTTIRGSQLEVWEDGLTVGFTHWTGFADNNPRVGPLSTHPVVDSTPKEEDGEGRRVAAVAALLPTPEQGAAIGAAASLAGLLYWIWPTLKGGFAGLFSRLTGPKLLEHPARANLVQLIQAEPGIHFQDLARRSGLPNGTAVHHLNKLADAGLIAARPLGRYTCYFPGSSPDRASLAAAPVTRSDGARRILAEVAANPGVTGTEVALRLGLQGSTVAYHVKRMEQAGLLSAIRDGRTVRLRTVVAGG